MCQNLYIFDVMEFFTSTGFYCLAIVTAIALLGVLLHPAPLAPAETYIAKLSLSPSDSTIPAISLSVGADGQVTLTRTGIVANIADTAINIVAEVRGNKVTIVEKFAHLPSGYAQAVEQTPIGTVQLSFFKKGRSAVRYESEVAGMWCTLSLLNAEGFHCSAQLRY